MDSLLSIVVESRLSWCHILVVMTYETVVIVDEGRIYYSVGDHYFLLKWWDTCFFFFYYRVRLRCFRYSRRFLSSTSYSLWFAILLILPQNLISAKIWIVESKFFKRKGKLLQLLIIRCLSFINVATWDYKQERNK